MQYTKPVDVWNSKTDLNKLQAGQWVYAGEPNNTGRFLGVKKSGTVVVAWQGNIFNQGRGRRIAYIQALRQFAKGR
jgi:hypothetical protein